MLASPKELQATLDKRDGSHWDVFSGCDSAIGEDGPHTVQMVCTDFSVGSNCHKIGLGHGVPGTIFQMPADCGPGKYAVARDMASTADQNKAILPRHLKHLSAHTPIVYDLAFDYDFTRVPRDLGDTQMRVDFSNQDDYWDTVVSSAANSKKKAKCSLADTDGNHLRWLEEEFRDDYHFGGLSRRGLEERWFGSSVLDWLARIIRPEIKREFNYNYRDTLTAKVIDETWQCDCDGVGYEGHLLAQALLKVNIQTSFGFTLIVTKLSLPLDLSQSYESDLDDPSFYAGVQALGDVTAKISAAVEFGVRFDKRWKVDPAATAVVGEANVMMKIGAGISTQDTCPFTWGLNVGARLFARSKAPAIFRWPGVEVPITPNYNKPVIKGGTCPELQA